MNNQAGDVAALEPKAPMTTAATLRSEQSLTLEAFRNNMNEMLGDINTDINDLEEALYAARQRRALILDGLNVESDAPVSEPRR